MALPTTGLTNGQTVVDGGITFEKIGFEGGVNIFRPQGGAASLTPTVTNVILGGGLIGGATTPPKVSARDTLVGLSGSIESATPIASGTVLHNLPASQRPPEDRIFPCAAEDRDGNPVQCNVRVYATGNVVLYPAVDVLKVFLDSIYIDLG